MPPAPSVAESSLAAPRAAAPKRTAAVLPPLWVDALLVVWLGVLLLTPFPQPGRYLAGDPLHYAAIAKSTLDSGQWLELRLGDQPYYNKPPLMFWLAMSAFQLFGASTFVAQSTGSLFGFALLLGTWALGCRLGDRRHGLLAAFVLATTYVFIRNATVLRLDAPLACCVLGGIGAVWAGRRRPALLPLFWISVALALAIKGAAGLLAVPVIALWSLLRRDAHPWRSLRFWSTLPLLPVPVLPWIVHNLQQHREVFVAAWLHDNVTLNLSADRGQPPFVKYGTDLVREAWPWLPFLLLGVFLAARALWRGSREDRWTLPAAWIAGVMAPLLCLSSGFSRYVLPLLPASTFLVAISLLTLWPRLVGRRLYRGLTLALVLFTAVVAVAGHRLVTDRTPDVVRFHPRLVERGQRDIVQLGGSVSLSVQAASIFYLDQAARPLTEADVAAQLATRPSLAVLVARSAPRPPPGVGPGVSARVLEEGSVYDLVLFSRADAASPGG